MRLTLERKEKSPDATWGELWMDGQYFCLTLEDPVRKDKIPGQTAIPSGNYEIKITYSARFKKQMPLLLNVPGFSGIRIHPGKTTQDTAGCILVGFERNEQKLLNSIPAYQDLYAQIQEALDCCERVFISIL